MNRRYFVKSTVMATAGALALRGRAWPFAQSPTGIRKFIVSLPGLGPSAKNEIGQYIPPKLYRAVAAVLAAIYRAEQRAQHAGVSRG